MKLEPRPSAFALALAAVALTLLGSAGASARLIDEFSPSTPPSGGEARNDPDVIGGERDVEIIGSGLSWQGLGGSGEADVMSGSGGTLVLVYDGDDDDATTNAFGLVGEDLADDDTATHFVIEVSDLAGSVGLTVDLYEDAFNFSRAVATIDSIGVHEIPLGSFTTALGSGASVAAVNAIVLTITGINSTEHIAIDRIATRGATPLDGFITPQAATTSPVVQTDPDVEGGKRLVGTNDARVTVDRGLVIMDQATSTTQLVQSIYNEGGSELAPPIDLTNGGAHDHLAIDLQDFDGISIGGELSDSAGNSLPIVQSMSGPGVVEILLSEFVDAGVDVTDVVDARLRVFLATGGTAHVDRFASAPAPPVDDFGDTQASVATSGALPGDTIEGGEREVLVSPPGLGFFETPKGDAAVVAASGDLDGVDVIYDGAGDDPGSLQYGLGSLDFEADGRNAFGLLAKTVTTPVPVTITVWTGSSFSNSRSLTKIISAPGLVSYPYADFTGAAGVDFSDVDQIALSFGAIPNGNRITLSRFTVLPEPGGALGLSAGAVALTCLARRARRSGHVLGRKDDRD